MIGTNAFGEIVRDNSDGYSFYAKSGGCGPSKTTSANGRTGNMKRLVNLRLMDPVANIYAAPACAVLGIFDGDVMLEDSLYMVDAIDNRIKLKRSPAFEVRALVSC